MTVRKQPWTDSDLVAAVERSRSFRQVAEALGLPGDAALAPLRAAVQRLGVSTAHFNGIRKRPYVTPTAQEKAKGPLDHHFISVVIPFLNECPSLRQLHEEITQAFSEALISRYEVIYIDDGSTDGGFDVCCALHEEDPEHVQVVRLARNFGQTAAMSAGFDAARGDLIIPMDADLQSDPADVPHLVSVVDQGYDVVSGWRVKRRDPWLTRRVPSLLANRLISWLTGVRLHDYGCTLKVYRKAMSHQIQFYGEMHRFLPALANWAGARVTETPVNHRRRIYGKSKYSPWRMVRVLLDLVTVKFLLSYSTQPMQVFGSWGIISWLIAFATGTLTIVLKLIYGNAHDITSNPWMYICLFSLLGGLQLIALGLLGEINVRTYYESQHKSIYTIREVRAPGLPQ